MNILADMAHVNKRDDRPTLKIGGIYCLHPVSARWYGYCLSPNPNDRLIIFTEGDVLLLLSMKLTNEQLLIVGQGFGTDEWVVVLFDEKLYAVCWRALHPVININDLRHQHE